MKVLRKIDAGVERGSNAVGRGISWFGYGILEDSKKCMEHGVNNIKRGSIKSGIGWTVLGTMEAIVGTPLFFLGKIMESKVGGRLITYSLLGFLCFKGVSGMIKGCGCEHRKPLTAEVKNNGENDTLSVIYRNGMGEILDKKGIVSGAVFFEKANEAKSTLATHNDLIAVIAKIDKGEIVETKKVSRNDPLCSKIAGVPLTEGYEPIEYGGDKWYVLAMKKEVDGKEIIYTPYNEDIMSGELAAIGIRNLLGIDYLARYIIKTTDRSNATKLDLIPSQVTVTVAIVEHLDPPSLTNESLLVSDLSRDLFQFAVNPAIPKIVRNKATATGIFQIIDKTGSTLNSRYKIVHNYNEWAEKKYFPKVTTTTWRYFSVTAGMGQLYHHIDVLKSLHNELDSAQLRNAIYSDTIKLICALASAYNGGPNRVVGYVKNFGDNWVDRVYDSMALGNIDTINKRIGLARIDPKYQNMVYTVKTYLDLGNGIRVNWGDTDSLS
ncbi:MAG: hypothetical protein QXG02_02815, partial [Candidatus Anstonellales archaeon]